MDDHERAGGLVRDRSAPLSGEPNSFRLLESARNRYRRIVVAGAVLVIAAILVTAACLVWRLRQEAIAGAEDDLDKFVHVLSEETARLFESLDIALTNVQRYVTADDASTAARFAAQVGATDVHRVLRMQARIIPQVQSMFIIGADGHVLASSRDGIKTSLDLRDRDYFTALRDGAGREPYVSVPSSGRNEGQWTIYVARRITAADGSFLGVVGAGIALDQFEAFYRAVYRGEGSSIGLNRDDGVLIARYPPLPERIGHMLPEMNQVAALIQEGKSVLTHITGDIRGLPVLLAVRPVPAYGLFAAVGLRESAMLANWRVQAIFIAIGSVLICAAVLAVAFLLLRQFAAYEIVATARDRSDRETDARRQLEYSMAIVEAAAEEARASEARMRRSEEHLTRAQELGSIGSFERYFAGDELSWSAEMYRIFGVDPRSFAVNMASHIALVHDDDRAAVTASHERATTGLIEPPLEYRIVRPDGTLRICRRKLGPIRDEAGTIIGLVGTMQDITEQRQSEIRLDLLQDLSLAIAEAEGFDAALRLVLKQVCARTDWAYGEAWLPDASGTSLYMGPVWHIDRPSLAVYAAERRAVVRDIGAGHIWQAWIDKCPVWVHDVSRGTNMRPMRRRRASEAGLISAYAVPICAGAEVLAIVRFGTMERREHDTGLTEIIAAVAAQLGAALKRKRVERALTDSQRMASEIIATALDAFIQMDQTGQVVEWNPHAERLFGWSREEAVERSAAELILPPGRQAEMTDGIASFVASGEWPAVGRMTQITAQRRDGRTLELERAVTALHRRDGIVFNMFLRDLTEKLTVERQLRQAQKMEAVGNLTGGIAHDFNNLLGAMIGNLDLLVEDLPAESASAEIAGEALHAALVGADLTRRLLAFARRQPLQPRVTDLNELVGGLSKMLRRVLGEQIEFELDLAARLRPILVDRAQLESAITNLATNARDAMPRGGRLTIKTRDAVLDADYAAANLGVVPGSYAEIEVGDTGTGMSPSVLRQIFEPFFTTKKEGKGSGLGLSMVFGFVTQSGGHVAVQSEEGEGTTVRLYLPHAEQAGEAAPDATEAPSITGGDETILVVEDNEKMRAVVERQLRGLGYRVLSAENAAAALETLAKGAAIDLLFSDIVMPGDMNGFELAREVSLRHAGIRVLLTSGFAETRIGDDGTSDLPRPKLLSKPYRLVELARAVREVIDGPET